MNEINSDKLNKFIKCIKARKQETEAKKRQDEIDAKRKLEGYVIYPINIWEKFLEESKKVFLKKYLLPYNPPSFQRVDFEYLCIISKSPKARILLGTWKGKYIVQKVIEKEYLINNKLVDNIKNEIRLYKSFKFPFILKNFFIQDHLYLYFVRSFCCGGDINWLVGCKGLLSEAESRFYISQVILTLEYLHILGIVHRNLTSNGVIISHDGYIKLINFGHARFAPTRGLSTLEAASPEMLKGQEYGCSHDCWSLGTMLYFMLTGKRPFLGTTQDETLMKTMCRCLCLPGSLSEEVLELMKLLLVVDPAVRLGSYCPSQIKCHPWFSTVPWTKLANKKVTPNFIPLCSSNPTKYCHSYPLEPLEKASFDKYDPIFNTF